MKKTNFFKLLMVGAVSLSLAFTSCNYVKDSELTEICDKVDLLSTDVAALKALLAGGVVKDITQNGNVLTVTYTGDKASTQINLGTAGGNLVEVAADGRVSIDGEATKWYLSDKAIAQGFYPKKSDDGKKWLFPTGEVGTDGKPVYVDGPSALPGTFVVKDTVSGLFTLNVPQADGTMVEILLPGAGSNIGKIDILGWAKGMDVAAATLSVPSLKNEMFPVNYAWIEKFQIDDESKSITTAATGTNAKAVSDWKVDGAAVTEWKAKRTVGVKYVLNTLEAERQGVVIQVHPSTTPVKSLVFELQNSLAGGVLPLAAAEPELISSLLTTRAAAESAVWFIPWKYTDGKAYNEKKNYSDLYEADAVYSLVTEGNRSEYTTWTVAAKDIKSVEAPVASINKNEPLKDGNYTGMYKAVVGTEYKIEFGDAATVAADETDQVIDYYVEVRDNNQYVETHFDVDIDKTKGTFKVNRQPDNLTIANFWLRVYKLGIDGVVYVEDIQIYVSREDNATVVREGAYAVVDANKYGVTTGTLSDADNKSDLGKMFTELAKISDSDFSNLAVRWQNVTYGAKFWSLAGVKIGGKAVNGSDYEDKINGDGTKLTLAAWKAIFTEAGGSIKFSKTNAISGEIASTEGQTCAGLYEAKYIIIEPSYARKDGTTPMFDIGSEYELTFEFYDEQKDYLSSAVVKFTPTIPALAGMFEKYPNKWNADKTTLMAYYEAPGTWENKYFFEDAQPFVGKATSTFYNVYATTANIVNHSAATPYDGGFVKFGLPSANDKEWLDGKAAVDFQRNAKGEVTQVVNPDGATDAEKLVNHYVTVGKVAAQGTSSVVELFNQTPNASTSDIAYNTDLKMTIVPGKYLGVYDYSKYETTKAQLADLNFNLRLMSAVERGEIKGSGAAGEIVADINAASVGEVFKITDAHVAAYNYNNNNSTAQKYSLFTVDGTKYQYTYIKEVSFFIPDGQQTYTFAKENGDVIDATTAKEIHVAAVGTTPAYSYVAIKSRNTFQTSNDTKIGVKVLDRFGKSKSAEILIKITVH